MSFRLKTIIGIAVIETVLLLILILTVLNFLKQTQSEELSKRIKIANQLLTTTAQDAMISSDLATLDSITAEFFKNLRAFHLSSSEFILAFMVSGSSETAARMARYP